MIKINNNNLLKCIEKTREELHKVSNDKGFSSNEVLKKSKKLDRLLNIYSKKLGDSKPKRKVI